MLLATRYIMKYDKKKLEKSEVFICHESTDKQFVRKLSADLEKLSINVWFDESKIKIGDPILEEINKGLSSCKYFIIVISKDTMDSTWVQKEFKLAIKLQKLKKLKILPVLLADITMPSSLKDLRYADCSGQYSIGLRDLVLTIAPEQAIKVPILEDEISIDAKLDWLFNKFSLETLHIQAANNIRLVSTEKNNFSDLKEDIKEKYFHLKKSKELSCKHYVSNIKSIRNALRDSLEYQVIDLFYWLYCAKPDPSNKDYKEHKKFQYMIVNADHGFDELGFNLVMQKFKHMVKFNCGFDFAKEKFKFFLIDEFITYCKSYLVFKHK